MYCKTCGTSLLPNASHCHACGDKIAHVQDTVPFLVYDPDKEVLSATASVVPQSSGIENFSSDDWETQCTDVNLQEPMDRFYPASSPMSIPHHSNGKNAFVSTSAYHIPNEHVLREEEEAFQRNERMFRFALGIFLLLLISLAGYLTYQYFFNRPLLHALIDLFS